ncbi:chromate transporter [Lactimicrobium massiliense]|uniref:chromate transporter n=1 Tax=Lactimicrobium massiliense TaxID=2161814 RepID=UPI000D560C31|nr:chromate transporter [Lactimicrobium massiliense]
MVFWELFITFFKIGAFTFGGGYAMLPLVEQEVAAHGWMTMDELINFIAVSESTPGPFAVNVSTYVGSIAAGIPGAFVATLGVVLPSFIVILLVARFFEAFKTSKVVSGMMKGLRPAVVGMITASFLSVAKAVFFPASITLTRLSAVSFWLSAGIFALTMYLLHKKVNPILLILLSAGIGIAAGTMGLL